MLFVIEIINEKWLTRYRHVKRLHSEESLMKIIKDLEPPGKEEITKTKKNGEED